MTTEEKTLLGVLTTAAVLVPILLGATLGWPVWSWLFLAVPLFGALGLAFRSIQRHVPWEERLPPQASPPSQAEQQHETLPSPIAVPLPSVVPDYAFHFSAAAYWCPVEGSAVQHADPGELAAHAIIDRARAITVVEQPGNVDILKHRLASELVMVRLDGSGGVEVWADQVQLTLSDTDRELLRRRSDLRKDDDLWELELARERRKRNYVSDVLKSTGSAVTWLLVQKKDDVEETARLLDKLAQLCAVANHAEVPALVQNGSSPKGSLPTTGFPTAGLMATPFSDVRPVVSKVGALMDSLDVVGDGRALYARYFAQVIERLGKPDEAQEIQRHFDAHATDSEPAERPESDGNPGPDVEPLPREET